MNVYFNTSYDWNIIPIGCNCFVPDNYMTRFNFEWYFQKMTLGNSLLVEYPEVFALYEEIRHYSELIVVQVDVIPDKLEPMQIMDSNYPAIATIHTVLQLIMSIISCLSTRQKHRQVAESNQ